MRTHDADLCERIRALEEEVAELRAELEVHRGLGQHRGWYINPYPLPLTNPYPWTVWYSNTTAIANAAGNSTPSGAYRIPIGGNT